MNKWQKFNSIVSVTLAIAMVVVAITAAQIARTANEIAQQSYEMIFQRNLPFISIVSTLHYDEAEGLWTEKLSLYNDGSSVRYVDCDTSTLLYMNLGINHTTESGDLVFTWTTYNSTAIRISQYFGYWGDEWQYTGNSTGLIATISKQNNYLFYQLIDNQFVEEASKDGYETYTDLKHFVYVDYTDYAGERWSGTYWIPPSGIAIEFNESWESVIPERFSEAGDTSSLAHNRGLSTIISELDGAELWHWYKAEFLG